LIVRISTEGQYDVSDADYVRLGELDNEVVVAVDAGDAVRFHELFSSMIALVRERGTAVADDALHGSDIILPPADLSMQEARTEFRGEGLIPG
jgi:hypothetical protein